ncbi:EAL domain-containing protein [Rhodoferax sp. GW822-FHT02A01]|uniref:EAL domain-containing protein n=1 Tax=Rhodoferax sp. GW822-FHT02A01 TaxID=3141537 RepID=UPI00315C93BE
MLHPLLQRQIKRLYGKREDLSVGMTALFEAISEAYYQADTDRVMVERSLDLASQEMFEQNRNLSKDLEARRAAESQVVRLSNFDELTGLPNRNLLDDRVNQAVAVARRQQRRFLVLVVGLDHFMSINDSLGHAAGNEMLKIVSTRLSSCTRGSDTVARLGNDEFALVLLDSSEAEAQVQQKLADADAYASDPYLVEILHRVLKTVSEPVMLAGRELQVTCSIGVSLFPQNGKECGALLHAASTAMNSAKRLGRNTFQFYTTELGARIEAQLAVQGQLRLAVERSEFVLHYQPQVDLRSGKVIGVEALVRWNHPELGLVPPSQFIALAEETGLIVPIGSWVIRTACEQCKIWREAGHGLLRVAVNLSVRQFEQLDLVEYITSILAQTGVEPQLLEIELTESLLMTDVERAKDVLWRLKALGLQMSIDDFGTGYSSLAYLTQFPIDFLKIDQSFVRNIGANNNAAIVKAIISMAHSLGMRVIAEGVETEAQCEFLRLNMCDEIQGYLFSKPLDARQIEDMVILDRRLPPELLHFEKPKRTVLLVDDEPFIVNALKRLLRNINAQIFTADGGQAGLEVLAKYSIDVIVSDQRMPGMTGMEFFRIVKDKYPDTIRIVLSGFTELNAITSMVNEGAIYKFLTKPWVDEQLLLAIEEAFQHKELADENQRLNLEVLTSNLELAVANKKLEEALHMKQLQIDSLSGLDF